MLSYHDIANAFAADAATAAPVDAVLAANHVTLEDLSKADYPLAALLGTAGVAHANVQWAVKAEQRNIWRERLQDVLDDIKAYLTK